MRLLIHICSIILQHLCQHESRLISRRDILHLLIDTEYQLYYTFDTCTRVRIGIPFRAIVITIAAVEMS